MSTTYFYDWQQKNETAGRITFLEGNGGLPKIEVVTAISTAEIYLQGAHVTQFQKKEQEPLLFLSVRSVGLRKDNRFAAAYPLFTRGSAPGMDRTLMGMLGIIHGNFGKRA